MYHKEKGDNIIELDYHKNTQSVDDSYVDTERLVKNLHTGFKVFIKKPASENVIGHRTIYYSIVNLHVHI